MITVLVLIAVAAFLLTIAEALGKCPGWVPKILICVWILIYSLPSGR